MRIGIQHGGVEIGALCRTAARSAWGGVGVGGWRASVVLVMGILPAVSALGDGDAVLPQTGWLLWTYPSDQPVGESGPAGDGVSGNSIAASPMVVFDRLLVPLAGPDRTGLVALDAAGVPGGVPRERWFCATKLGVHRATAAWRDLVFFSTGRPGDRGRGVYCVRLEDGRPPRQPNVAWPHPVAPEASGVFDVAAGLVVVQDRPGRLTGLDIAGRVQFSVEAGRLEHAPTITATMIVAASVDPVALWILDRGTGATLWRAGLSARPVAAVVCTDIGVYVPTTTGLEGYDWVTGRRLAGWEAPGDIPAGPVVAAAGCVMFVTDGGDLVMCRAVTGQALRRIAGPVFAQSVMLGGDRVLYAGPRGWSMLDVEALESATPVSWASWPGRTEPLDRPVFHGGRVYVSVAGLGLACWGAGP